VKRKRNVGEKRKRRRRRPSQLHPAVAVDRVLQRSAAQMQMQMQGPIAVFVDKNLIWLGNQLRPLSKHAAVIGREREATLWLADTSDEY
jgi:hypothetical protein